jgi:hypothetical protein
MTGGSITGNTATSFGLGVFIDGNGEMTMTGGSITGNTNANGTNDVAVSVSSNNKVSSLTLSGDARIGRIWIKRSSVSPAPHGNVFIEGTFTGSDTVAILDLGSTVTALRDKQILQGSEVLSSYSRFTLGDFRDYFSTSNGITPIDPNHYAIDSDGYLRFTE